MQVKTNVHKKSFFSLMLLRFVIEIFELSGISEGLSETSWIESNLIKPSALSLVDDTLLFRF